MEPEKEINQNQFKNKYVKLAINIIYTGNWLTNRLLDKMSNASRLVEKLG